MDNDEYVSLKGCVTLAAENFPLPMYSGGGLGWGVERRLAYATPTLALPLSTWGGEEQGVQNVSLNLARRGQASNLTSTHEELTYLPLAGIPAVLADDEEQRVIA
jgi:hypothetical protein